MSASMPRGPMNKLHTAAKNGSTERTIALLSNGSTFDIDQGDPQGWTPLMYAAGGGYHRIARILLNKGASPSQVADSGFTALFIAVERGHLAITKLLVNAGASPEISLTKEGTTPLHMAASLGRLETMGVLIEAGANVNSRGSNGVTPIHVAAQEGKVDAVKMLLRAKADPLLTTSMQSGRSFVPLDAAAQCGHLEVARELIRQRGIEGCRGASGGVDALELAAQKQHVDILAVLIDAGVADTGAALRSAVEFGREASVKFLLGQQRGKALSERAYVDSPDKNGATPLLYSSGFARRVRTPSPRIARLLLDAGADATSIVRLPGADGRVAFEYTPLAYLTDFLRNLKDRGEEHAAEDQLHRLEGTRRVLLRLEAVHAVSWLWHQSDTPATVRAAEGASSSTTTSPPLGMVLPLLRRRARRRGMPLSTVFRHAQKTT